MDVQVYYLHRVIANWIQTAGVVFAAAGFLFSLVENRRRRALNRYEDITTRWLSFFQTVRAHPELDLDPLGPEHPGAGDAPGQRIRDVSYLELFVLLERVLVLAATKRSPARFGDPVLANMIARYARRSEFREAWSRARGFFDTRF